MFKKLDNNDYDDNNYDKYDDDEGGDLKQSLAKGRLKIRMI